MSKLPICFALIMTLSELEKGETGLVKFFHYYACMV